MKSEVFEKPWPDEMRLSAAKGTTSGSTIDVVLSNQTTGQSFVSQSNSYKKALAACLLPGLLVARGQGLLAAVGVHHGHRGHVHDVFHLVAGLQHMYRRTHAQQNRPNGLGFA